MIPSCCCSTAISMPWERREAQLGKEGSPLCVTRCGRPVLSAFLKQLGWWISSEGLLILGWEPYYKLVCRTFQKQACSWFVWQLVHNSGWKIVVCDNGLLITLYSTSILAGLKDDSVIGKYMEIIPQVARKFQFCFNLMQVCFENFV